MLSVINSQSNQLCEQYATKFNLVMWAKEVKHGVILRGFQTAWPFNCWAALKARRGPSGQNKCLYPWHVNESLMIQGSFTFSKGDRQGPARVVTSVHIPSSTLQGKTSRGSFLKPGGENHSPSFSEKGNLWHKWGKHSRSPTKTCQKRIVDKKVVKNCFFLFSPFKKQGWGTGGKDEGRKNWTFYYFMAQSYLLS